MRTRSEPKVVPPRAPYFTIQVLEPGPELTLRAPSVSAATALGKSVPEQQQKQLLGIAAKAASGGNLLGLLLAADEVLPLLAGVVGICWADPMLELESARAEDELLAAYGARVMEELHEEGWEVQHVALAAMSIFDRVRKSTEISREVAERLAFLAPTRASSRPSGSASRPSGSDGSEDEPSTN